MSLATTIAVTIKAVQALANDNFAIAQDPAQLPYTGESWTSGVAASQADLVYRGRRTLASTTSENLDLSGVLTDRFGNVLTMARVKLIAIFNRAAIGSGYLLKVGGAASNPFINWVADGTDIVQVRPQGLLLLTAPDATAYAVTAATGDLLKVNNANAASVDYDIVVVGASA